LYERHQRVNLTGHVVTYRFPSLLWNRRDSHFYVINARSADECIHNTPCDLQIDDASAAYISPSPRQAIGVIAVLFEILAPGLSPEGLRDSSSPDDHR